MPYIKKIYTNLKAGKYLFKRKVGRVRKLFYGFETATAQYQADEVFYMLSTYRLFYPRNLNSCEVNSFRAHHWRMYISFAVN